MMANDLKIDIAALDAAQKRMCRMFIVEHT